MLNFTSKPWSILTTVALFLCFKSNAQLRCGTPSPNKIQQTRTVELRNEIIKGIKSARTDSSVKGVVYLPVRPHIVRKNDKSGALPLFDLNNSLAICNKFFINAGQGIQFFIAGTEPNYVDDSTLYDFNSGKKDASGKTMEERITAANAVKNAINVYFVGNLLADGKSLAGYAYFPTREASSNTCVMLNGQTNDNSTFAHEFGHYFNVFHTFQGNNDTIPERELVTRLEVENGKRKPANCDLKGDLFCDTPSDPFDRKPKVTNCVYADTTLKDANGDIFEPSMRNIMSYFECNNDTFTPNQYTMMGVVGLNERLNPANEYTLVGTKAWQPSIVKAPSIKKLEFNVLNGVTIAWRDSSSNETGFFVERSESKKGPFLGVGGMAPNDTVFVDKTVSSNQKYYYRVKPSNTTTGSYSNIDSLITGAVYCKPTFANGCASSSKGDIDKFILEGDSTIIKNEKSGCSTANYGDFTKQSTQLTGGKKYKFTLGTSLMEDTTFFSLNSSIWIDFNKDGVFTGTAVDEGSEMVYQGKISGDNNKIDSLTIPQTALAGDTRMRVRVQRITGGAVLSACAEYFTGETEDYSVTISNPKPTKAPINYCVPVYTYPCVKGGLISKFDLRADSLSISKSDTACSGGYNNYRNQTSAMVKAGKKYNFSVAMNSDSTTLPYAVSVWADLNNDGIFNGSSVGQNSEMLYLGITNPKGTLSDSIRIPLSSKSGTYALRVRTQRATYGAVTDACERYTFGSTSDYAIVVKDTSTKKTGRIATPMAEAKRGEFQAMGGENTPIVYPNPTDGSIVFVKVENAEEAKLNLYNSMGNEVPIIKSIVSQYVMTLKPMQDINSGLYFISIYEDGKRTVQKVMVAK
jgi:GEVED domain/Secretion system C-terminal sorting domain/Pregnancy-associated plasma protein-A